MKIIPTSPYASILMSALLLSQMACNGNTLSNETQEISKSFNKIKPSSKLMDSFDKQNPAWKAYAGKWQFANGELKQTSTEDYFPVILRTDKQFSDLDISIEFQPISGRIDASGGIIFRAKDENNYYIVRANALEDNYRLYTFINGQRSQIASATVTPPELNKISKMRVVTQGDHIQAYLNGKLQIDYHDKTYHKGYIGLWTKADSVTSFDNLEIKSFDK